MELLKLLLGLEGQLLSGSPTDLLTPEQTGLLVGKEGRATRVLLDCFLIHDLMTLIFTLRRRALGLQAMLMGPIERLVLQAVLTNTVLDVMLSVLVVGSCKCA